ncbi:Hypothetical predicted protein [Cloeon dipterum]|uniref:DUF19 domain-containing protein n=1 Tax=Cloeon dipterum TaxID=197152 RepID=A0A8S1DFW8_9INSE|nr:Hypothetical predicted protein [Cloeon dipterum]
MTPYKLLLLLLSASLFSLVQAQSATDDTKLKIQEKKLSIKSLIAKIRARIDKKSSSKGKAAKLIQAGIDCADSNIQGVDSCCPGIEKALKVALNSKNCAALGSKTIRASTYTKYSLNLLQDLASNKLNLEKLNDTLKEQVCASECLIRGIRANSRQMDILPTGKKGKSYSQDKFFKAAFDECKTPAKDFLKKTVDFKTKKCSVAAYVQLQCAIRKSLLECNSYSTEDLCMAQKEHLLFCDPFKF